MGWPRMQTYTLLYQDPAAHGAIRMVSFKAQTAHRAVRLLREFPLRDKCELWTEGGYVCTLRVLPGRKRWCVISSEALAVDIEVEAQVPMAGPERRVSSPPDVA